MPLAQADFMAQCIEIVLLVCVLIHLWRRERLIRAFMDLMDELTDRVENLRVLQEEWTLEPDREEPE